MTCWQMTLQSLGSVLLRNAHKRKKAETKVLINPKSKCPYIHSFTYHTRGKSCALFDNVRKRNLDSRKGKRLTPVPNYQTAKE